MARANKLRKTAHSNKTKLMLNPLSSGDASQSTIAGSGSGDGEETPVIRSKDRLAAAEDGQYQEPQAEVSANGLAGVINSASLRRTRSSVKKAHVPIEVNIVIPAPKEPRTAAPPTLESKLKGARRPLKAKKPVDRASVCESENAENANHDTALQGNQPEGNSQAVLQISETVRGRKASTSLSQAPRSRVWQAAGHHVRSRKMSDESHNSLFIITPGQSVSENRSSTPQSQPSQNDGPDVADAEEDCNRQEEPEKLEVEENASSSQRVMLESLSVTIGKLGQRRTTKGKEGKKIDLDLGYWTTIGRQISRDADRLRQIYTEMWAAESAENVDHRLIGRKHQRAIDNLSKLESKCRVMLAERLGNRADGERNAENRSRTKMLEDIYIHVVPHLVDALKAAGKSDSEPDEWTIEGIQEFLKLLEILNDVAETTRLQDRSIQPTSEGRPFYLLASPTHQLLPILKKLREKSEGELKFRRREEIRRRQPELSRKRREREAEEARIKEDIFQQRRHERQQKIAAELEQTRKRLGMLSSQPAQKPFSTQLSWASINDEEWLHDDLSRIEDEDWRERNDEVVNWVAGEDFQQRRQERRRAVVADLEDRKRQRSQPVRKLPSTQLRQMDVDDEEWPQDNRQADTEIEVGYFGQNNLPAGTGPQRWSPSEMRILIEGLRQDQGPSRYGKVAVRLKRTMDEIFKQAKYLKDQAEYTLKRLQEEDPHETYPPVKPWIQNIGSERYNAL